MLCFGSVSAKEKGGKIMLEALRNVIGPAPAGLEFIEYLVLVGFTVASVYFVYKLISIIFSLF